MSIFDDTLGDAALDLQQQGMSLQDIAFELGQSAQELRDWLYQYALNNTSDNSTLAFGETDLWPRSWTTEDLEDLPNYNASAWAENIALIEDSTIKGNLNVSIFFKRYVDFIREQMITTTSPSLLEWSIAHSALPIIGQQFGCTSAAMSIRKAISDHRPWSCCNTIPYKINCRTRYLEEVTPYVAPFIGRIKNKLDSEIMPISQNTGNYSPAHLLQALVERVPLFDISPKESEFGHYKLGSIILGILTLRV